MHVKICTQMCKLSFSDENLAFCTSYAIFYNNLYYKNSIFCLVRNLTLGHFVIHFARNFYERY